MRKLTTDEWIVKAKLVHGNKYDYSKVKYEKSNRKIVIVCNEHGAWEQNPASHLIGSGCPECGKIKVANAKRMTLEEFKAKAIKIHDNIYDYSQVVYKNNNTKVTIICPIHGEFQQNPADHLEGKKCNKCAGNKKPTVAEFIEKAKEVHGLRYNYDKVKYKTSRDKITITCPVHGDFEQQPNNHLMGKGCSGCTKSGFNNNNPAILYYLKITTDSGQELYKIGITSKSVDKRFSLTDLKKIEIVKQRTYENGKDAYNKEQEILKKYAEYKYDGPDILESGNTELFTVDIREVNLETPQ